MFGSQPHQQKFWVEYLADVLFRDPGKVSVHEALSIGLLIGFVLGFLFVLVFITLILVSIFIYMLLEKCLRSTVDSLSWGTLLLTGLALCMAVCIGLFASNHPC
ncbi:hypothetical protein M8J76_001943 [Diaphorina citri]|nr:hypothetical protein M8J76_001943 [Diaphorina citri]